MTANRSSAAPATAADLLADATAHCRDCPASFPALGEGYVDCADGFVRCLACAERGGAA